MKKTIGIIFLLVLACLLAIFVFTLIDKRNSANGFNRRVTKSKVSIINTFKLPDPLFGFAGKPNNEIMLYNYKSPYDLFEIDDSLKNLKKTSLKLPSGFNANSGYIKFDIDSSYIYLFNTEGDVMTLYNNVPALYKLPINESDQSLALSRSSIITRSLEKEGKTKDLVLIKAILAEKSVVRERYKLPKHTDTFFGNDGRLRSDKEHSRIFYMYSYLGEFLCLDTNLKLIYKAKTIDTVKNAKIKLGSYKTTLNNGKKANQLTQGVPPRFVNKDFTTNKDRIYILSSLKADNETTSFYNHNQPVDVYSMKDGKYIYSFYIPKFKNYGIRKIEIKNDILMAIFDTYISTFNFKELL